MRNHVDKDIVVNEEPSVTRTLVNEEPSVYKDIALV